MLLRLLKIFGMKEVKPVIDAYSHHSDMMKKPNCILFQLSKEKAIVEGSQTKLRFSLVQIPVALDESNGSEICCMCDLSKMSIYTKEMTNV